MTKNGNDYHTLYVDGNVWTGIWTSSAVDRPRLVNVLNGLGEAMGYMGNWGPQNTRYARSALDSEDALFVNTSSKYCI